MGGGLGGGIGGGPWALWSLARLSFAGEEAWDPGTVGFLLLGGTATCGDHNHNYNDAELENYIRIFYKNECGFDKRLSFKSAMRPDLLTQTS